MTDRPFISVRPVLSFLFAGLFWGTLQSGCSASAPHHPTRPGESVESSKSVAPPVLARAGSGPKASALPKAPLVTAQSIASKYGLKLIWVDPAAKKFVLKSVAWTLEFEVDSRECFINGNRVFLGEGVRLAKSDPVLSKIDADKLIAPILRPGSGAPLAPELKVIVIDPGHGGVDSGMVNAKLGLQEKQLTLDTALRLKSLLERDGYRVVMTRADDHAVALSERPEVADKIGADLFVSIHFNSVKTGADAVTGLEVFTMAPQNQLSSDMEPDPIYAPVKNPGNEQDHWNTVLGYSIHRALIQELKVPDRGLKRSRFAVLRLAHCPAVLVESGYLSNDSEAKRLANPKYRQHIAEGLADGISRYAVQLAAARKK